MLNSNELDYRDILFYIPEKGDDELLIYQKDYKKIHKMFGGMCYNEHILDNDYQYRQGFITDINNLISLGYYDLKKDYFQFKDTGWNPTHKLDALYIIGTNLCIVRSDKMKALIMCEITELNVTLSNFEYIVLNRTEKHVFTYHDQKLLLSLKDSMEIYEYYAIFFPIKDGDNLIIINPVKFLDLNKPKNASKMLLNYSKSLCNGMDDSYSKAFRLWHLHSSKANDGNGEEFYFIPNKLDFVSEVHMKYDIRIGSMGHRSESFGDFTIFWKKEEDTILLIAINEKHDYYCRFAYDNISYRDFLERKREIFSNITRQTKIEFYGKNLNFKYILKIIDNVDELFGNKMKLVFNSDDPITEFLHEIYRSRYFPDFDYEFLAKWLKQTKENYDDYKYDEDYNYLTNETVATFLYGEILENLNFRNKHRIKLFELYNPFK
jgi:hypothetical protein